VDDATNLFHALSGQMSWQATTRLRLTVADSFTVSDQPGQADALGLRTGRDTFTSNLLAVTGDYVLPLLATRAYHRLGTFSSDDDSGDTTANAVGAAVTATLAVANVLSVGYEYLDSQASDPADDIAGHQLTASLGRPFSTFLFGGLAASYSYSFASERGGNFQIATASLYGSYVIPGSWLLSGSIGVSQFISESLPDRTEPFDSGTLTSFFPRGTAAIRYDAGFSETFRLGQNFGIIYTSGITGSLGLGYQMRRWLSLSAGYAYTDQRDPVGDAQPFTENRVFMSLNAAF
jgi:hypothetical protein